MSSASSPAFFKSIKTFNDFQGVAEDENYHPLPDDWFLAMADIVSSTEAIASGRYKDVNIAGASVISAVLNAVDGKGYPFVFGGDGATLALPQIFDAQVRDALLGVRQWIGKELKLDLRIALIPLSEIRRHGHDVKVARYAASEHVSYAMFSGGGVAWAERQMKTGAYRIEDRGISPPAPDFSGLSCRWRPIQAKHGRIVSLIVAPGGGDTGAKFRDLILKITTLTRSHQREGHPITEDGLKLAFTPRPIIREAQMRKGLRQRVRSALSASLQMILTAWSLALKISVGRFNADLYRSDIVGNSDFRKFDDGLKMTLDIDDALLARLRALLDEAKQQGIARYGLHSQDSALMTCFVPTALSKDHVHFIDGGSGGYAAAASAMRKSFS